jgi:hypothetical protein
MTLNFADPADFINCIVYLLSVPKKVKNKELHGAKMMRKIGYNSGVKKRQN